MHKQVCQTNPAQPSYSLIRIICHPRIFKFSNAVTEHSYKHEKEAPAAYVLTLKERHVSIQVKEHGMFVNNQYSLLHVTLDYQLLLLH